LFQPVKNVSSFPSIEAKSTEKKNVVLVEKSREVWQGGLHGLPEVSLLYPSTPCGRPPPETTFGTVLGVAISIPPWMPHRPVREGVFTDSLKFLPAPPCPTLIRPAGGPPPKRPSSSPLDTPRRTGLLGCPMPYVHGKKFLL
jgi:hypothetical protein